jgi:hypothetical protein
MKRKVALLIFTFLISPIACAGKELGNGGDARGLEFRALASQALDELAKSGIATATPGKISRLRETLASAIILSVSKPLIVTANGIEQDCAVVNVPQIKSILISDKWDGITDSRVKRAMTVHELEGLLGEEKTGVYMLSADYLNYTGYRGDSLEALSVANGREDSSKHKGTGGLEEYLCYEDDSKQAGIEISIGYGTLTVYTVGLKAQNGGMYSDGDSRESIATYQEKRSRQSDGFSLESGTVMPNSGGYTDALGFIRIEFAVVNGKVDSFVGFKRDGSALSYRNCVLRLVRN